MILQHLTICFVQIKVMTLLAIVFTASPSQAGQIVHPSYCGNVAPSEDYACVARGLHADWERIDRRQVLQDRVATVRRLIRLKGRVNR